MRPAEYIQYDAMGLAYLVDRGEVTPQDLIEAAVERIDSLNGKINAVVERAFDLARDAAAKADRSRPLAGVPFLAKDMNIEVAGLHLTSSCRWLAQLSPAAADSPLAARWRSAGLSILGRTNTPEFAGDFVTEPTWRGATLNPWDLTRSPGSSSGGAAASVASGMVPIAHGTELAGGLDCEHVLSRSIRDTALMLDLTQGWEPASRYPLRPPPRGFLEALTEAPRPLCIGVALRTAGGDEPAEEVGAAVTEAAELLAGAGHRVVQFQYPKSSAHFAEPAAVIWMTATAEEIDHSRGLLAGGPKSNELEALSWACVALGERRTALDYVRARRMLTQATRDMNGAFQSIDLLLSPTTSRCALPTGSIDGRTANFDLERWNADSYGYAPYTELFNVTGQPAISLPLAQSKWGLPIGVQIVAPLGEDAGLLRLAAWFERERPWAARLAELQRRYLA